MNEKITVLISDDNNEFATTLANYLEKDEDMQVVGMAKDGEEALSIISTLKPDVVLLDVIMPHLDGLGVLERLSSMRLEKRPICIMLSAVGQDKITQKSNNFRGSILCCKTIRHRSINKKNKRIEILSAFYKQRKLYCERNEIPVHRYTTTN